MADPALLGTYCLRYARGDSFASRFAITDNNGAAQDITGWTFILTVNTERNPLDTDEQQFSVNGVIEDALAGLVSFAPSTSDTDLPQGTYWYDVQQIDGAGRVRTIIKDQFIIDQDITKV